MSRPPHVYELADQRAEAMVSPPKLLSGGYRRYEHFDVSIPGPDGRRLELERDILRGGDVVGIIPFDPVRREIVLIRQFRLPSHLMLDLGNMVEIVAGRVEAGEAIERAAHRECVEEIGVEPLRLVRLFRFLTTPGLTDECVTVFVAAIDAAKVPERSGAPGEAEDTRPFRVPLENIVSASPVDKVHTGLSLIVLQWLALNHDRLDDLVSPVPP